MHPVELNEPLSGFQKHMGYELVEWSDGFAKLIMPIGPHLLNREGIPHGGRLPPYWIRPWVLPDHTRVTPITTYCDDIKSVGELHGKSEWQPFDHIR